ncbi:kinase-like domain-containing protein [Penicillium cataractarum]|uniref:Kinase-like domain-containing protein n=1 Tax=Penicillium cataractarum TaxID=2100454 RepID=A0A9W9SFK6_9EURO|nr:kinase-like domain-containing protein [Penicillium cataractarum]KAJ5377686.1 kinase-like domain-containing protein [Penicillium cataractarum]
MLTQATQLLEGPYGVQMELDHLEPGPDEDLDHYGRFAMLVPMNAVARSAIEATSRSGSAYHQQFIGQTFVGDRVTKCFTLSLGRLPEFAHIGWRIGRGRDTLKNRGVDLLLTIEDRRIDQDSDENRVAGIHARLNWVKGAGGFFLIADNGRGEPVMMDGEIYRNNQRSIQLKNSIMIGECVFTLRYYPRNPEEDEQFQVELAEFFRVFHDDANPLVLPLPSDN